MPACFELISKSSKERERLSTVDEAICAHVGVEPDPKYYYRSWVCAPVPSPGDPAVCAHGVYNTEFCTKCGGVV